MCRQGRRNATTGNARLLWPRGHPAAVPHLGVGEHSLIVHASPAPCTCRLLLLLGLLLGCLLLLLLLPCRRRRYTGRRQRRRCRRGKRKPPLHTASALSRCHAPLAAPRRSCPKLSGGERGPAFRPDGCTVGLLD